MYLVTRESLTLAESLTLRWRQSSRWPASIRSSASRLDRIAPALIFLDLMMPAMDGLTFLTERERRGTALDVPVICVSVATGELLARAPALGAPAVVPKPTDFDRKRANTGLTPRRDCLKRPEPQ